MTALLRSVGGGRPGKRGNGAEASDESQEGSSSGAQIHANHALSRNGVTLKSDNAIIKSNSSTAADLKVETLEEQKGRSHSPATAPSAAPPGPEVS